MRKLNHLYVVGFAIFPKEFRAHHQRAIKEISHIYHRQLCIMRRTELPMRKIHNIIIERSRDGEKWQRKRKKGRKE